MNNSTIGYLSVSHWTLSGSIHTPLISRVSLLCLLLSLCIFCSDPQLSWRLFTWALQCQVSRIPFATSNLCTSRAISGQYLVIELNAASPLRKLAKQPMFPFLFIFIFLFFWGPSLSYCSSHSWWVKVTGFVFGLPSRARDRFVSRPNNLPMYLSNYSIARLRWK